MNRRVLGRGRLLASSGAVVMLIGCLLPWWTAGGSALPARSGNGLEGAGILVFLAAVATLALVALPYAAGDRPVALDRPASFVATVVVGVVALALAVVQLLEPGGLGLPDRSPGLWLAAIGLAIVAWGAAEVVSEPPRR